MKLFEFQFENKTLGNKRIKKYFSAARILHTKFDQACDVIFMASK